VGQFCGERKAEVFRTNVIRGLENRVDRLSNDGYVLPARSRSQSTESGHNPGDLTAFARKTRKPIAD
jgi:hypothetical protein